jgi:hypothetical protein
MSVQNHHSPATFIDGGIWSNVTTLAFDHPSLQMAIQAIKNGGGTTSHRTHSPPSMWGGLFLIFGTMPIITPYNI